MNREWDPSTGLQGYQIVATAGESKCGILNLYLRNPSFFSVSPKKESFTSDPACEKIL